MESLRRCLLVAGVFAVSSGLIGCGKKSTSPETAKPNQASQSDEKTNDKHDKDDDHDHGSKKAGHSHDSWWCDEHGVPEERCGQCNSKVAAEFQKKGDWCKEHNRPDSQCFKCHPELQKKFAAQYEAKMGKKPPTPEG